MTVIHSKERPALSKRMAPRKRTIEEVMALEEEEAKFDAEENDNDEPKKGLVPAAADLLESLSLPLRRFGKREAALSLRKGARKLRGSADQINGFAQGVSQIVQAVQQAKK
jgi:hypothetical protein